MSQVAQYLRVLEAGKANGELLIHQDWFIARLNEADIVQPGSTEWVRLDSLVFGDYKMFRLTALSSDRRFGRDEQGYIYVAKDHALAILTWELELTKGKLAEAYYFLWFLGLLLLMAVVAPWFS